jgi:hypothetical protein
LTIVIPPGVWYNQGTGLGKPTERKDIKNMYFNEMTNYAKRNFIKFILDNTERDYTAVEMVQKFVNNEMTTEEIENVVYGE